MRRMSRLYYIIGASGSGKDSVMAYARQRLCAADRCLFAHRYITRPAGAGGENHVALTPGEFQARLAAGLFALSWESHGNRYGVGVEVEHWLAAGFSVVVNGSRASLPEARARFPQLTPVLIAVDPAILRQRLLGRGRESADEVEKRIRRSGEIDAPLDEVLRIANDGALPEAGERLLELVGASAAATV